MSTLLFGVNITLPLGVNYPLLLGAGLAAGIVNALAGGGSLITFPALLAAGLPPVSANVTNSVAVSPGYVTSVLASRVELAGQRRRMLQMFPATIAGTLLGCVLLLTTPPRAFELVVPWLVLGATAMLALPKRRASARSTHPAVLQLTAFAGAVYGGYFGAALGVMMVAALSLVLAEPLARIGALKNFSAAVCGLTTVAVFAVFGDVRWAAVAVVAPATMIGGFLGVRLARVLPAKVLKVVILCFGTAVGVWLLVK